MTARVPPTVCVVSDDAALRRRALAVFTGQGYTARAAASLPELIAAAQGIACALVDPRLRDLQPAPGRTFAVGEGVVGWVVQNATSTIVGDSDMDRRFVDLDGRSSRSMLVVPVLVGERVLGAVSLVRRAPAAQFVDADLVLVGTIRHSAAIALAKARLYGQERALALRLQGRSQL